MNFKLVVIATMVLALSFADVAFATNIPNITVAGSAAGCLARGSNGSSGTVTLTVTWAGTGTPSGSPGSSYGTSAGATNISGMSQNGASASSGAPTAWTTSGTPPTSTFTVPVTWTVTNGVNVDGNSQFDVCITLTLGKKRNGQARYFTKYCWDMYPCP